MNTSILTSHLNPNKKIWIYFWQLILFIQTCPAYFVTHLALVMDNCKISIGFSIWKDQQGCTVPLLLSNWADRVNWRVVVFLWECWKDCLVSPSLQLQLLKTMSNQFTLQECQVRFESNKPERPSWSTSLIRFKVSSGALLFAAFDNCLFWDIVKYP